MTRLKCCRHGDVEAVQDFLAIGKDVNEQDGEGRSPLHYAVAYSHADILEELLDAGADLEARVHSCSLLYNVSLTCRTVMGVVQSACELSLYASEAWGVHQLFISTAVHQWRFRRCLPLACRIQKGTPPCTMRRAMGGARWSGGCWKPVQGQPRRTARDSCHWTSYRAWSSLPLQVILKQCFLLFVKLHGVVLWVQVRTQEPY